MNYKDTRRSKCKDKLESRLIADLLKFLRVQLAYIDDDLLNQCIYYNSSNMV
jgi:hypothetical protein